MALVAAAHSGAGSWYADAGAGGLTFEATQASARFTGRFTRFSADIDFDPAVPQACRFEVTIETGSAVTGESQRDGLLQGKDFFWIERYPTASYNGSACRREQAGYALDGQMTLRGVTHPVTLNFNFSPVPDGGGRMTGRASVQRLAFGVGQGEWAATEWLGNEVTVQFDLSLPAKAAKK
jgi:polyisoprenoid-binding protein YceI